MSEHVPETVTHDFPDPRTAENVTYDPSFDELRAFSEHLETTTEYGSPSYVSEFRSRSADRTKNSVDDEFTESDRGLMDAAQDRARESELVCLDRMVGRHDETAFCCRLYVPKEYGRIALAWAKLLEPAPEGREPDFETLQLPDEADTRIRVDVDAGVTYVLGSDYTGEAKKSSCGSTCTARSSWAVWASTPVASASASRTRPATSRPSARRSWASRPPGSPR